MTAPHDVRDLAVANTYEPVRIAVPVSPQLDFQGPGQSFRLETCQLYYRMMVVQHLQKVTAPHHVWYLAVANTYEPVRIAVPLALALS